MPPDAAGAEVEREKKTEESGAKFEKAFLVKCKLQRAGACLLIPGVMLTNKQETWGAVRRSSLRERERKHKKRGLIGRRKGGREGKGRERRKAERGRERMSRSRETEGVQFISFKIYTVSNFLNSVRLILAALCVVNFPVFTFSALSTKISCTFLCFSLFFLTI